VNVTSSNTTPASTGSDPSAWSRTSGTASSSAKMPRAAASPSMPWCSRIRSSRSGRNTSTPSIRMTSSAGSGIAPKLTRHAPSASAAAAPTAMPASVMPRASVLVASTNIVLLNSTRARSSSRRPRSPLWPNALSVASPCTASRKSAPNAEYARLRARLAWLSQRCHSVGAIKMRIAAASITSATGRSRNATKPKISTGVSPATKSCGRYWPK
jgi:hypothetical protein